MTNEVNNGVATLSRFGRGFLIFLSAFMVFRSALLYYDPSMATSVVLSMVKSLHVFPEWAFFLKNATNVHQVDFHREQYPTLAHLHYLLGSIYMICGPIQFIKGLRTNFPVIHRWNGYLFFGALACLIVDGLAYTAPFYAVTIGGFPWEMFIFVLAIQQAVSASIALYYALNKNFVAHREWMIRNVGTMYCIPVIRLVTMFVSPIGKYYFVRILPLFSLCQTMDAVMQVP